jgi:hypothetical protein
MSRLAMSWSRSVKPRVVLAVLRLLPLLTAACVCAARPPPPDAGSPAALDAGSNQPNPRQVIDDTFKALDAGALHGSLEQAATQLQASLASVQPLTLAAVTEVLERHVANNLEAKRLAGLPLQVERVRREVIEYEAFKVEAFVKSGVFPKRYFGYLDERGDTAAYERRLKRAARSSALVCNQWLASQHASIQVTEQELIVTFLAEGGAMLLREEQQQLEAIHPVAGIGLDDITKGFVDLAPLVRSLDAEVGTHLQEIVVGDAGAPRLSRRFTFEEAIAGTAAMWVWEKRIAEAKLVAASRPSLATRPLDEQFIITSLVYNSGILFGQPVIDDLRRFELGPYLFDISERSKAKHWALPVLPPVGSLRLLLGGHDYPEQQTSWSAAYHVLQRYGAYEALRRFTDDFDVSGALK